MNWVTIDQDHTNATSPWIMVTDHKDGTPSENTIVANNIVYRSVSASGIDVTASNNYLVGRDNADLLDDIFADPDNFDFHLERSDLTLGSIIDQGESFEGMISSEVDRDDTVRTGPPDLGAYEAE